MPHDRRSLLHLLGPLSLHVSEPQALRGLQTPVWGGENSFCGAGENDLSVSARDSLTYWWFRFTRIFILNL